MQIAPPLNGVRKPEFLAGVAATLATVLALFAALLHPLAHLLLHLVVLLLLLVVQYGFNAAFGLLANRPRLLGTILSRERAVAENLLHLFLLLAQKRQNLLLLIVRQIELLAQKMKPPVGIGTMMPHNRLAVLAVSGTGGLVLRYRSGHGRSQPENRAKGK
jgi:hypothetical protein